jgi:uncharacterized protein
MSAKTRVTAALLAGLSIVALSGCASSTAAHGGLTAADKAVLNSPSFVGTHADHRYRVEGSHEYAAGRYERARSSFTRAARLADKLSQAMLAELHWEGLGGPVDRPAGYAWMDLAAERDWPHLLAKREHYWNQLNEAEREQALRVGATIYQEFGDEVAQPRMERELASALRQGPGVSRMGSAWRVYEMDGGMSRVPGDVITSPMQLGKEVVGFYQPKFWQPEYYWATLDRAYGVPELGQGEVTVRELQQPKPQDHRSSN